MGDTGPGLRARLWRRGGGWRRCGAALTQAAHGILGLLLAAVGYNTASLQYERGQALRRKLAHRARTAD